MGLDVVFPAKLVLLARGELTRKDRLRECQEIPEGEC